MTVLSDKSIKKLSATPTHIRLTSHGDREFLIADVTHSADLIDAWVCNPNQYVRTVTAADLEKFNWKPMISPYFATKVKIDEQGNKIASYGQSSGGYDIRCAPEFKLFCGVDGEPIDYKNIREDQFETIKADQVILPPNSFVLSRSIEKIAMPRDVIALCIGKSTPARAAISCLCTPLEPGWEGYVTLEFANTSNQPVILYANEGAVQLVFLKLDEECEVGYSDNGSGKYQSQLPEITLPRV